MSSASRVTNADYPYDFTLTVYAEDYMPITDTSGRTSEDRSITYYDSGENVTPQPQPQPEPQPNPQPEPQPEPQPQPEP